MIRGEGTAVVKGVTAQEIFDFVIDPAQYRKADTKIIWVTKLVDLPDGMVGREDGYFAGLKFLRGSVVTKYKWEPPHKIDVWGLHGFPEHIHAWFEISEVVGGTRIHHVEEMKFGHGLLGRGLEMLAGRWFADSVRQEVNEIARLMEAGERGRGLDYHEESTR